MTFHDIRFPIDIARGAHGGPERRTDVVVLGSGAEERNARWADSRRSWNAGYGVKSITDLNTVITFFEERRGRLHGFRWRDPLDHSSAQPGNTPQATDQVIGSGDGTTATFDLVKTYGTDFAPYTRRITKPIFGSVLIALDGIIEHPTTHDVDHATGRVTFNAGYTPAPGITITAGYFFDVPVRFDTDKLEVSLSNFKSGAIPSIPLIEIRH